MRGMPLLRKMALSLGLFGACLLVGPSQGQADDLACTVGQLPKVIRGLILAPVPLDLERKNPLLVGLGSYIVNAQGACNDCHTWPSFTPGGDPYRGEPKHINAANYMAGGRPFGPVLESSNITPCQNGQPAGLDLEDFITVMRTGKDPEDGHLLQVMPWPIYGEMSRCELRAIYEFLRAIPGHNGGTCAPKPGRP